MAAALLATAGVAFLGLAGLGAWQCVPVAGIVGWLVALPLLMMARGQVASSGPRRALLALALGGLALPALTIHRFGQWEDKFHRLALHGERLARAAVAAGDPLPAPLAEEASRWRRWGAQDPPVEGRLDLPTPQGVFQVVVRKSWVAGDYWHFQVMRRDPKWDDEYAEVMAPQLAGDWTWPDLAHLADRDPDRLLAMVRAQHQEVAPLP